MKKRITATTLFLLIIAQAVSCGGMGSPSDTTSMHTADISEVTTEAAYVYPELDLGGGDFTILNGSNTWSIYNALDFESLTGETLDDAIYNRNRSLESRYNFNLKVVEYEQNAKLVPHLRSVVMAGEDIYDAAYCQTNLIGPLISEDFFLNLHNVPGLQLSEPWWDHAVVSEGTIGENNALYFAASDLQLFGLEGTWCTYFNETMLEDLGLNAPYDLVREGKWTFDRLWEYMKAGVDLNGDESFTFNVDGNSIYGMTSSYAFPTACIISSGERYISKDKNGTPSFALETDRFYRLVDKLASMYGSVGEYISKNNSSGKDHYEEIFKAGRALFMGAEIKTAGKLRDFEDSFGIVPNPKLDETQENYYSNLSKATLLLTIPTTSADPENAGIILDALSYMSYTDTLPLYYDIRVSQKSLRNDESIEMLAIIRDSRYFDIGDAYGWTTTLQDRVRKTLDVGSADIASIIAAEKPAIETNIAETLKKMS
jgi:hypothetical protein